MIADVRDAGPEDYYERPWIKICVWRWSTLRAAIVEVLVIINTGVFSGMACA